MSESINYASPEKLARQWTADNHSYSPIFPTWAETIIDYSSFGLKDGRMVDSSLYLVGWHALFDSPRQLEEFLFTYLVTRQTSAERYQKYTWLKLFIEKPGVFEAFIRRDSISANRSANYFDVADEDRPAVALLSACVPSEDSGIASQYESSWSKDLTATVRLMINGLRPHYVTQALESGVDADLMNALVTSS